VRPLALALLLCASCDIQDTDYGIVKAYVASKATSDIKYEFDPPTALSDPALAYVFPDLKFYEVHRRFGNLIPMQNDWCILAFDRKARCVIPTNRLADLRSYIRPVCSEDDGRLTICLLGNLFGLETGCCTGRYAAFTPRDIASKQGLLSATLHDPFLGNDFQLCALVDAQGRVTGISHSYKGHTHK
jgi:hypothetical protein